jgi:hypothetical protein
MSATDAREVLILNSQFGGGATTWAPATWFVALSTTTPNDDGSNFTPPSGGSYARVSKTNNTTNWGATATTDGSGVTSCKNATAITFPTPTADWGVITHAGLYTASSGGTPEYVIELDTPITVRNGNTPVEFAINQLVITCS